MNIPKQDLMLLIYGSPDDPIYEKYQMLYPPEFCKRCGNIIFSGRAKKICEFCKEEIEYEKYKKRKEKRL